MKQPTLLAALVAATFLAGCGTLAGDKDRAGSAEHRTVGQAVDDLTIGTEIKAKLAADPDLSALKINVDTTEGAVRLRGDVKSLSLRQKAEALVRGIKGVKSVDNQLVITG